MIGKCLSPATFVISSIWFIMLEIDPQITFNLPSTYLLGSKDNNFLINLNLSPRSLYCLSRGISSTNKIK
jgi:hypothetical protein